MTTAWKRKIVSLLDRSILAALVIAAAALGAALTVRPARSAEIVPSIGMTRSVNGSDQTKTSYGLALRQNIAPMLTAEIGGSYRKEDLYNGTTRETQWPVTASLWLRPVSALYAGGGVGWYHTTLSYPQAPALAGSTTEKFGVHLGGGIELPLVPAVASLDLNGRYIYLGNQASQLPPQQFKANYWTTSLGVALHF